LTQYYENVWEKSIKLKEIGVVHAERIAASIKRLDEFERTDY